MYIKKIIKNQQKMANRVQFVLLQTLLKLLCNLNVLMAVYFILLLVFF